MRKILLTLCISFLLFGCGQKKDRYYSCEGEWDINKEINHKTLSEKKKGVEPFVVNYIFGGNLFQRIMGSIPIERFTFMKEYWRDDDQVKRQREGSWLNGTVNETEMTSVITNSLYYIGNHNQKEENLDKKTYWFRSQWFQLDRVSGKIEYELKSDSNEYSDSRPTHEISTFVGKCSKVDEKF